MGLLFGSDDTVNSKTREFIHQFAEQNGAVRCSELLGLDESSGKVLLASAQNRKKEVCEGLVRGVVHTLLGQLEEMNETERTGDE